MKMYNQTQISPENTYIYALNMVNKNEGTVGELQDETGNELCYKIPKNYTLMGTIETPKKKTYLLLQGSTFKIIEIKGCKGVEKLDIACFTYQNPIKGEYRIINENQELLYFYDGVEPDRYFNLSHPEYHTNCESFLLKPNYNTAQIRMIDLSETGGDLPSGAYTIKARYVDKIGNVTDWFSETLPYPISALGSFNNPTTVEGNDVNVPTTKALIYKFWNIDTDYPYVEIAVNKYTDEYTVQSFSYGKFKTETELQISITSINNLSLIDYKSTTIPTAKYENSKTMLQNDNRLIRANLTSKKFDWGKFQIKANNIQVTYTIRQIIDANTPYYTDIYDSSKSMNFKAGNKSGQYYTNKSLMRDEVYAVGIVWIMKDGSESPVFHIPGRKKDLCADGTDAPSVEPNLHNRIPQNAGWDSSVYNTADYSDADIFANSVGLSTFERWQGYNTGFDNSNTLEGSYYECRDLNNEPIRYPDITDCDGKLIYPNTDGVMDAIRHCKTPDTTLLPHYEFDGTNYYINCLHFLFDNIAVPAEYANDVVAYKIVIGDRTNDKTIVDKGILGTILEQNYNQNLTEAVDDGNSDIRKGYIQSMQFSHDNQTPKSYTLQTGLEFVGTGGNETMICLPACSDSIAYDEENCEEIQDLATATATRLVGYHSPLSKVKGAELNGTHIKWEREIYTSLDFDTDNYYLSNEHFYVHNNRKKIKNRQTTNLLSTNVYYRFDKSYIPFELLTNRVIKNSVFVAADSTFNGDVKQLTSISTDKSGVFNNKTQQEVNVFQVEGTMDADPYLSQYWRMDKDGTFPDDFKDPSNDDKNQWAVPGTYTAAFNFQAQEDIDVIFRVGGWMSHNYVSIKRYKTDCYKDLTKIKYLDYSNVLWQYDGNINSYSAIVTAGDIFICRMAFRQSFYGYVPHAGDMSVSSNLFGKDGKNSGGNKSLKDQNNIAINPEINSIFESKIIDTYYESEINMEWREHNNDIWNNTFFLDDDAKKKNESYDAPNAVVKPNLFYPKYYGVKGSELLMLEINSNSISRLDDHGQWKYYELFKNYYKLNPVYNIKAPNYRLLPLQEYRCDTNLFPNRVIWSEKANNEERKDTYRRFLANNYKDIEGNTSYITDVFEKKGNLYLHTNESLFHLPRTSEQLQLRDSGLNIGTGEYLSLPQVQLTNTNYNFAGQQGRFNRFTTENGIFFVNQEQGMIYNFGENLQSISDDMQQWFYKNLPSELNSYFENNFGYSYPLIDNTINRYGIGLQSTIDYNLSRWLLHKKDYLPLFNVEEFTGNPGIANVLYFASHVNLYNKDWYNVFLIWISEENSYDFVDFNNPYFFQNKSWTLSYDMENKSWISYHSYQPNWMYQDGTTFYTLNGNIWRHGSGGQRYFYDNSYDARIEWQVSKQKEIVDGISYIMRCQYYDSEVQQWQDYDSDFTKGFLYNTYQTTYMFETTDNELYLWQDFVKKVNIRERIRTINGFRQLNENIPVIVSDWATLQQDYQGYEPYTVVNIPGNYAQNFSRMNSIRDIYTNARMYFQKQPWFRIRWQMVDTQRTKSIR